MVVSRLQDLDCALAEAALHYAGAGYDVVAHLVGELLELPDVGICAYSHGCLPAANYTICAARAQRRREFA